MRKTLSIILLFCSIIFLLSTCKKKNEFKHLDCSKIDSKYSTAIKSIISSNCTLSGCHDGSSSASNLTTYDKVKPFVDNGQFNEQVIKTKAMPQNRSLSQDERNKIKCWLDDGGPNN
ncbi:MAG: hypothetical protein ACJ76F_14120 [Bacteroidia bacterium]